RMDQGIGRVLDTLRKKGIEDDTLILFMSDNGGCHENTDNRKLHKAGTRAGERGSFRAYERPWANASNTPFRLFKHWIHEGGISTPLIARWPSHIRQTGALTRQVAHITDVMATCLKVAGAEYPREYAGRPITPLVGRSLMPVFEGRTREPHPRLYWEHFGNRGVREGNSKLVATKDGQWELYDIEADRTELNNLVDKNRPRAVELYNAWEQWANDCGAKIPPGGKLNA
ncbi:MAG: sulfatase-like hydrolase/transferase, partial [Candidatus Hydrogenedentes bacterium]|nr:sulfatase-like hydrolase/transferase [Candidatus Hydrogenedentota bacterium]